MSPPPSGDDDDAVPDQAAPRPDGLERLREILVAPERARIAELQARLADLTLRAEQHSRMLPTAVRLSSQRDGDLARALTPVVETALSDSIRRDPTVLTDAIFPIIGPAIRKSIAEALAGLVQSLNQTLEHTLSIQSFRWRMEAKRTGKSFAEVVLSRTLVYRVEQVFLIHRKTGLLLQHVHRLSGPDENADLISGMFTAIQDFARDTLGVAREETLETMQVGDLNVWLNTSPHVTLAAVIRGAAPQDFRVVLQNAIEQIHRDQTEMLESFDGDPAPFQVTRPWLEDCLRTQVAAERAREKKQKKKQRLRHAKWAMATAALLLVGGVVYLAVRQRQRHAANLAAEEQRQRAGAARRTSLVEGLRAQPGTVVTGAEEQDGKFHVTGLRDPLAPDPTGVVAASGMDPASVVLHWEPYYALTPGIILQRAHRRLQPPAGVTLTLRGETLTAEGSAPASWIASARRVAGSTPGVSEYDDHRLRDATPGLLATKLQEIERTVVAFGTGTELPPGEAVKVALLASRIDELRRDAAGTTRGEPTVHATGHVTGAESVVYPFDLGTKRAAFVAAMLRAAAPETETGRTGTRTTGTRVGTTAGVSFQVTFDPVSGKVSTP